MRLSRRMFSRSFLALGVGAAAVAQDLQPSPGRPSRNRRLVTLDISPTFVLRRDPESKSVTSVAMTAFSEDNDDALLNRLYQRPIITNEDFQEGRFDSLVLPVPISGSPDFGDLHELENGESIDITVNILDGDLRPMQRAGLLAVPLSATMPGAVKIGSFTITLEKRTDIDPPCLSGANRLTGVRMKFDVDWLFGTNRLFSAYLSESRSTRFLHGEIDLLFTKLKWCWTFNAVFAEILKYTVALLYKGLEAAGFNETAAIVNNTANALLKAIKQLVPDLIP